MHIDYLRRKVDGKVGGEAPGAAPAPLAASE
jgi:hypothetical protein